jgi:hypothetical protein
LTSKGAEIKSAMQEEYGPDKGESVFYASANKGTITGVDAMNDEHPLSPAGSGFDDDIPERTCDNEEALDQMSSPMPSSISMPSPMPTGDQPIVMPSEPPLETEHPQLHPDGSTPPEMALGDASGGGTGAVYGGIVGGLTDWGKDCFHDNFSAPPPPTANPAESPGLPEITPNELLAQSQRYWGQME